MDDGVLLHAKLRCTKHFLFPHRPWHGIRTASERQPGTGEFWPSWALRVLSSGGLPDGEEV